MLTLLELIVMSPDIDIAKKIQLLDRLEEGYWEPREEEGVRLMLLSGVKMDFNRKMAPFRQNSSLSQQELMRKAKEIVWHSYLDPLLNGDKALANDQNKMIAKAEEILHELLAR